METIKHIGRDSAILAAFVAGAIVLTLMAQGLATLLIDLGEMLM